MALLLVLTVGCGSPSGDGDGDAAVEGAPGPADGPGTGPERPPVPITCDTATRDAAAAPVVAQIEALGAGDFASAYAQASPFFRTVVDPDRFAALIRTEYPELLDVRSSRITGCTVLNRRALLVVAVTATDGARRTLAYELGETVEEAWRIDGAYGGAPPVPAPPAPQA